MSSQLLDDIPPKRRLAILRKKQAEAAAAEAEASRNKNLDTIATPDDHQANFRVDAVSVMAGVRGSANALFSGDRAEENPVLNLCIKRIGKLEEQMEELVETNKKLGDLLSKVADRVGISQD